MLKRTSHGSSLCARLIAGLMLFGLFLAGIRPAQAEGQWLNLEQTCGRIAGKLASIQLKDCLEGGLILSGAYSNKGIPILAKEYGALDHRSPQARVLLVGGTHGDEYSSISIVFKWMQILDVHHSGLFHWIFIPLLNPDGLPQRKSTRTNAGGVDLNRNFPGPLRQEVGYRRWEEGARKDPRYYPGLFPRSEPEVGFLVDLINNFKPHAIVSVHSPLNLVDYDGPGPPPSSLGSLGLRRLENFPGTLGNFGGPQNRIPVITIELASSARLPSGAEISSIWRDIVSWLVNNIPVEPGLERVHASDTEVLLGKEFFGK